MAMLKNPTFDHWREHAPIYRDAKTGMSTCLGPFLITETEPGFWTVDDDGKILASVRGDLFTAYRAMVDVYEAWWKRLPKKRVYFVGQAAKLGRQVKIGVSQNIQSRLSNLQVGSQVELQILAHVEGDERLESEYHSRFARQRRLGEWFAISPGILREIERLNGLGQ